MGLLSLLDSLLTSLHSSSKNGPRICPGALLYFPSYPPDYLTVHVE